MNLFRFTKNAQKVLGVNRRNLRYVMPTTKKGTAFVTDNKLSCKKALMKAGLPTPQTLAVIKNPRELSEFDWLSLPNSFVLKPNKGLGGGGILIVYGKKKNDPQTWIKADRSRVNLAELKTHVLNILDGTYSPYSMPDIAFFEERVKILKLLKPYSFRGIPDIRIIAYNLVPVMAELRLPTESSGGKANLHLGGIGVGIDLGTGVTTTAIHRNHLINYVPNTRHLLSGIKISNWKDILELASSAQKCIGLNLMGIDIAIDRDKGPMILEINSKPGLSIQIANLAPLSERLKRIEGLKINTIKKAIRVAQELFGGEIEEELEDISGRKVIGLNEPIEIIDQADNKYLTLCKIDTGAYRTTICKSLAEQLGLLKKIISIKKVKSALGTEERPIINLSFLLDKRLVRTEAFVADRSQMKYDVIVGRRDLRRFLVDPAKNIFMSEKTLEKIKIKKGVR